MPDGIPVGLEDNLYDTSSRGIRMGRSTPPPTGQRDGDSPEPNPDPETNPYLVERPPYRDAEWLHEQYHEQEKSLSQIAREQGVPLNVITAEFERNGIEQRPTGRDRLREIGAYDKLYSEEWLYGQYWTLGKSTVEIAEELGVSQRTVAYQLRNHGIELRSFSEAQQLRHAKARGEWDGPKTSNDLNDHGGTGDKTADE